MEFIVQKMNRDLLGRTFEECVNVVVVVHQVTGVSSIEFAFDVWEILGDIIPNEVILINLESE